MPIFNDRGKLIGMGICSVASIYNEVREAVITIYVRTRKYAIRVITSNPAKLLKLKNKGSIIYRK